MTGLALPTLNMVSGVMFLLFPAASEEASLGVWAGLIRTTLRF